MAFYSTLKYDIPKDLNDVGLNSRPHISGILAERNLKVRLG
jgi:hypothetical protein